MSKSTAIFHGEFGRAAFLNSGRKLIPHAHREAHLLFHIEGGHSQIRVNGESHSLSPASVVAVNPWELHGYLPDRSEAQHLLVLYLRPAWFCDHSAGHRDIPKFGCSQFPVTPDVLAMARQVTHILTGGGNGSLFERLLYELTETCHHLSHHRKPAEDPGEVKFATNDFRVRRSLKILGERVGSHLDIAKLAEQSGLSRPHFFKLFRSQIGIPPKLFWNTMRLERAFHELVETPKPIHEIGFELGFSSQSSFSRFFCLNTGLAPTDYRRVGHVLPA